MLRTSMVGIALLWGLLGSACSSNSSEAVDAGSQSLDAAIVDASSSEGADASVADASAPDATVPDASAPDAGPPCGCVAGEYCDTLGVCQSAPAPTGAFCGPASGCLPDDPDYPQCTGQQCMSNDCGSAPTQAGVFIVRDVCIQPCQIYQDLLDEDGLNAPDGINDADAPQEDCEPPAVFDGPAGTRYRCVAVTAPQQSSAAVCMPGTHFAACSTNADCPADEACEAMVIQGAVELRCKARYRENSSWAGTVVRLGQSCNTDPAMGDLAYCEDGMCVDGLCSETCATDADCDTTAVNVGQGCVGQLCESDGTTACTVDADCSTMACTRTIDLGALSFTVCEARN